MHARIVCSLPESCSSWSFPWIAEIQLSLAESLAIRVDSTMSHVQSSNDLSFVIESPILLLTHQPINRHTDLIYHSVSLCEWEISNLFTFLGNKL